MTTSTPCGPKQSITARTSPVQKPVPPRLRGLVLLALLAAASLLAGGCFNLSPNYAPPEMPIPVEYKEEKGWKTAVPSDTTARGPWWGLFQDATLDGLMAQAEAANQNLALAAANLRQARAQIGIARSALLPGVSAPASATRTGTDSTTSQSKYSYGFSAQWEISFWNALPALEAAKAQSEGSAADFATMRLAVQAELATAYFQLRSLDGQESLYESTITSYRKAVTLTESQLRGGMVTRMDVDQATAQLAAAEAQLASVRRRRAELEHAIAVLVGKIPSSFSLAKDMLAASIPPVPKELPSALLERRPDIAAAERRVAVANQQIGLARAAWFPSLTLGGDYLASGTGWHSSPIWAWSVGPSAALSLFQGGKRLAESDSAWAQYEGEVASYRQTVLEAFKDVEDNLSALRHLQTEAAAQKRAVQATLSAVKIARSQYSGGMTTYLQVVSSQEAALSSQRSDIELQADRLVATVNLIKALGGGFRKEDLAALVKEPPKHGATKQ